MTMQSWTLSSTAVAVALAGGIGITVAGPDGIAGPDGSTGILRLPVGVTACSEEEVERVTVRRSACRFAPRQIARN